MLCHSTHEEIFKRNSSGPYQQDEEHEEHVAQEENGSQDPVGVFDFVEVKVSKNGSKEGEDGVDESPEVANLQWYFSVLDSCLKPGSSQKNSTFLNFMLEKSVFPGIFLQNSGIKTIMNAYISLRK